MRSDSPIFEDNDHIWAVGSCLHLGFACDSEWGSFLGWRKQGSDALSFASAQILVFSSPVFLHSIDKHTTEAHFKMNSIPISATRPSTGIRIAQVVGLTTSAYLAGKYPVISMPNRLLTIVQVPSEASAGRVCPPCWMHQLLCSPSSGRRSSTRARSQLPQWLSCPPSSLAILPTEVCLHSFQVRTNILTFARTHCIFKLHPLHNCSHSSSQHRALYRLRHVRRQQQTSREGFIARQRLSH